MIALVLAASATLAAADGASFDNTTCKAFLTGSWDMAVATDMGGAEGRILTRAVYGADGAFAATLRIEPPGGVAPTQQALTGRWDAAPGPSSDSCNAAVRIDGQEQADTVLVVLDRNTVRAEDGAVARRVTMTAAAP